MNVEEFRDYCLSLPQAKENVPWAEPRYQNLVTFAVAGKWFALLDLDKKSCNIKCAPETVASMQEKYRAACPAWHMNKTHWLGVKLDSDMPDDVIKVLLKEGYTLVVRGLSKAKRAESDLH